MQDTTFYQSHLDRVSRSFAFCIGQLEQPMRNWVSLSYLLCRMLDTVEDAPWDDAARRDTAFREFDALMQRPDPGRMAEWVGSFPPDIPEGERWLLQDATVLFADVNALPEAARTVIHQTVRTMRQGMQHYAQARGTEDALRLESLTEVNRYCYFVAGVVGHLLTQLFLLSRPDFAPHDALMRDAFHFGLFLQKINLLKDQRADELEGRFLVPHRRMLLASLRANTAGSIAYLTALPVDAREYRLFCAWSLFLGLASLPHMEQAYSEGTAKKIGRTETLELMQQVGEIVQDNAALRRALGDYVQVLPPAAEARHAPDWFCAMSGDALRPSELSDLQVL